MLLFLCLLPSWALFATSALAESCYWPNGNPAPTNYVRCPNQKICCATGEACLSNKLCYGAKYNIAYRGACVEKSWPEADCSRACYDEIPDGWANLYPCPNNTNQIFTCGRPGWAADVCKTNLGKFSWPEAQVAIARVSLPMLTSGSISSSITSTPPRTKLTGTANPSSITTTAAGSSDHSAVPMGVGLGVGLGVPLLLVSVGILVFCVFGRRQSSKVVNVDHTGLYGFVGQPATNMPIRKFHDGRVRELDSEMERRELEA